MLLFLHLLNNNLLTLYHVPQNVLPRTMGLGAKAYLGRQTHKPMITKRSKVSLTFMDYPTEQFV